MEVMKLAAGLWRWTAPHPAWTAAAGGPGGWQQEVGCIYYEAAAAHQLVLIEPQAPPAGSDDAARFWRALDGDFERLRWPIAVLIGNRHHARCAGEIARRYGDRLAVEIWGLASERRRLSSKPTKTFAAGDTLPGAVETFPIEGLDGDEVALFIRAHRALVVSDALIGAGGGRVRVAPRSWAPTGDAAVALYTTRFRPSLARLSSLPFDALLVSHGEPVLRSGRAALEEALTAPAWGEATET